MTRADEEPDLADDPMISRMFPDLDEAYREGRMTREEFTNVVMFRIQNIMRLEENSQPDEHMRVDTDEVVAVVCKAAEDAPPDVFESSIPLAAVNAILSGPPSSAAQRRRWPRGIDLAEDPVATMIIVDGAVCLRFESEDAARVWVWKMNYHVFAGEGAAMLFVQNMRFPTFRLPENLNHFIGYVVSGSLEASSTSPGGLKLREGVEDKMGRYEANQGRASDGREPKSTWIARTCRRLTGELVYETGTGREPEVPADGFIHDATAPPPPTEARAQPPPPPASDE